MYENFKTALEGRDSPSIDLIIQALASAYLEGPLTTEELKGHRQLMIREINNPTEAFEYAADHTLRPLFRHLQQHLKPILPGPSTEESLTLDILCIFGMLLYFNYSRPMISRITGKRYDSTFKRRLVHHLVRFSLHGVAANGEE